MYKLGYVIGRMVSSYKRGYYGGFDHHLVEKQKQDTRMEILRVYGEEGSKVPAVKRYREMTGAGLRDSVDYVNGVLKELEKYKINGKL